MGEMEHCIRYSDDRRGITAALGFMVEYGKRGERMNFSNYRLSLDIHETESGLSLRAKKGDTIRKLYVTLMDGGAPYRITPDCTAAFTARKSDDTVIFNEAAIENNAIVYELTPQTTAAAGQVRCEVRLYGGDGRLITSPRFFLDVDDTVFTEGDEVVSEDEYTILEDAIQKVDQAVADFEALIASGHFTDLVSQAFLHKTGGTMSGDIRMDGHRVAGLGVPVEPGDAATKGYADGKGMIFCGRTVSLKDWEEAEELREAGYPYRGRVALEEARETMVADVYLSAEDAVSGNFSPAAVSFDGGVYLFAVSKPAAALTIPAIRLTKQEGAWV